MHPPHHHGPQWIVAVHDPNLPREAFAAHLASAGEVLEINTSIEIGGRVIHLPGAVTFDLRYERTPHGSLALLFKAEWPEHREGLSPLLRSDDLVIRAPQREAGSAA